MHPKAYNYHYNKWKGFGWDEREWEWVRNVIWNMDEREKSVALNSNKQKELMWRGREKTQTRKECIFLFSLHFTIFGYCPHMCMGTHCAPSHMERIEITLSRFRMHTLHKYTSEHTLDTEWALVFHWVCCLLFFQGWCLFTYFVTISLTGLRRKII